MHTITKSIPSLYSSLAGAIYRHHRIVLAGMLILFFAGIIAATGIQFQSSSDQYLDKSTPKGILYDQYNEQFVSDTYILLIQTADPADYSLLQDLLILEEEIKRLEYVTDTNSLADVLITANGGVMPQNPQTNKDVIALLPAELRDTFIPDSQTGLLYVSIKQGISTDVSQAILPNLETLTTEADLPPGTTIDVTGATPYNVELQNDMVMSGVVLIVGALVLMMIVLFVLFSNMRHWYLPLILLTFGLVYTFAMLSLLGVKINNGAIASFPILLGLGIDYAVQFHARFDEERREGVPMERATKDTLKNTGPAVLLAMLATSMGFIAMFISPVPMIRTFAVVSIIGVVCCYLTSLFGFPALAALFGYIPKTGKPTTMMRVMTRYTHLLEGVVARVSSSAIPILIVAVVIAFAGISLDPSIPIDTDTKSMAPADLPAQIALDKVQDVRGSVTPFPLYIRGDDLKSLEAIRWIDAFSTKAVSDHAELTKADSIASLVRKQNGGVMPDNQGTLNAVLASIPDSKKDPYLEGDSEAAISFTTLILTIDEQNELKKQVMADVVWSEPPPHIEVYPTGDFDLYTNLMDMIASSKEAMTNLGFVLIFLFLILAYRKIYAITPVVPIICIVGWNAVAMILINLHYNPISACLGSMTIGVAAEYTILVMERFTEEKEQAGDPADAIRTSVEKIGSAVTVSGLVTAGGFSALMLSVFPIVSSFGLSTVIAVLFSLVGAIVIMPAVLTVMVTTEKWLRKQREIGLPDNSSGDH
ncbi:efflux RND transporter permease subunit [Methanogenium organophilum]|uniref:Hydrophobe/amphiphile efflux-3 (HAE3) family transporter n=1 Tax=Methanogenium organophilum TaxID=2199 RepID=A0A9X9S5I7_METOG|nr:hydrophobe/amphiphile efflux-3 (HAE3) family transporter [Methanogenium organophilum]WAI02056.1 hydrophobe/amphiphile efflux-3 (HAE3) family transporter [Methanogenium organophilum]